MLTPNRFNLVAILLAALLSSAAAITQAAPLSLKQDASAVRNRMMITKTSPDTNSSSAQIFTLRMPSGTRPETVKAVLNGKDVSEQFHENSCSNGACLSATLTTADGLRVGENTLYATANNQDGTASSSRLHFEQLRPQQSASAAHTLSFSKAAATPQASSPTLPTLSSFLPPAVAFTTLAPGGGSTSANWIEIGTQMQLSTSGCTSLYSVLVLNRQTLQPITTAPESSPQCLDNSGALASYLKALLPAQGTQSADLVIVGTTFGNVTDTLTSATGPFDTHSIGGRIYGCTANCTPAFVPDRPQQYMAIGVPGANPGSAYENFTTPTVSGPNAIATGTLAEDASGNYNFQPGPNVEFMVQPGATAASAYVQINSTPTNRTYNVVYGPPSLANSAGGFWLLVLDRNNLNSVPTCPSNPPSNGVIIVPNCGTFIATTGPQGSPSNIAQLGPALAAVTSSQIAILTTVGTAGWGTPTAMASAASGADNGMYEIAVALLNFGIPDKLILQTGTTGSTYTMIGSPGLGGPLNGHNVLSTNYLKNQGQTGYVHGTFALDNHGLYEPSHVQQEPGFNASTGVATDTANLQLGLVLSQQPVEWPVFTAPPGQQDAYKYLSWYLLNNWYFIGQLTANGPQDAVAPPLAYDIHYFFTGSLNTWIDIHTFDPNNVSFPSSSNGCNSCTWMGPDGTQLNFSVSDLAFAQYQLHNEIADLTNVLNLFVTGSANIKDVVASGNTNSALALLQASAEVQANLEQQVVLNPATVAKVSPWHIVNMIAKDVSPYVSFATDGAISPGDVKIADKAIGVIGDMITYAGSIGGGLSSGKQSSSADIPRLDYSLDTTVGQLAGLGLQGQFLAGFDATLDLITGDWNKLQALGSSAVTNPLYSPTQVAQNTAIAQITTAEQRSMYMSLVPSVFQDHVWYMTSGVSALPDLGYTPSGNLNSCTTFYPGIIKPPTGTIAPGIYVSYPTYGGSSFQEPWQGDSGNIFPFQFSENNPYQDWYVLSLPFLNPGHSNAAATIMDVALANILFGNGAGDVNLSLDEFVATGGPMDQPVTGGSTTVINFATTNGASPTFSPNTNAIGISNGNICSQTEINASGLTANPPGGNSGGTGNSTAPANASITTLQIPSSAVLGDNVDLQAKVVIQASSAPAGGSVQIRDGSTVMQTAVLDAMGSATFTTNTLALGPHSLTASFASTDGSLPSDSEPQILTVYGDSPDLALSTSASAVTVARGSASSPMTLSVTSKYGAAGNLSLSCVGLPLGTTCNFNPAQGSLTDGSTITTSLTISTAQTAAFGLFGLLFLPLFGARAKRRRQMFVTSVLLGGMAIASFTGCSGDKNYYQVGAQTGTTQVFVSATVNGITRTIPISVTIN